jgi:hypothetical protein
VTPARLAAQQPLFEYCESIYTVCFAGAFVGAVACLFLRIAWFDARADLREPKPPAPGLEVIQ